MMDAKIRTIDIKIKICLYTCFIAQTLCIRYFSWYLSKLFVDLLSCDTFYNSSMIFFGNTIVRTISHDISSKVAQPFSKYMCDTLWSTKVSHDRRLSMGAIL